ncbi:hypothetical protein JCM3770_005557 [Rhodotorula araucariae]
MLPALAITALCALLPASLALPVADPSSLDFANWRVLPPSLTLYNATLPKHPAAHIPSHGPPVLAAPAVPLSLERVKRSPEPVVKNPKVVNNPKNPFYSSSLAQVATGRTSTRAQAAVPSSSSAPSSAAAKPTTPAAMTSSAGWQTTTSARAQSSTTTTTTSALASATGGSGQAFSGGWATYYYQNGNPGHCGWYLQDTDSIVALPTKTYANGAHCGKYVRVTRVSDGASVKAMVADSCPTCVNDSSIDMSVVAFTSIATEEEGMVAVTWEFI